MKQYTITAVKKDGTVFGSKTVADAFVTNWIDYFSTFTDDIRVKDIAKIPLKR